MSSRSVLRCPSGQTMRKGYSYVNKKSGKRVSVKGKCVKKGKRSGKKSVTRKAKSPARGMGQCLSGETYRKGYSYTNKKSGKHIKVSGKCVKKGKRSAKSVHRSAHRVSKSGCHSPSKWIVPKAYCRSPRK